MHCAIIKNQCSESLGRNWRNTKKWHIKCKIKGNNIDNNKKKKLHKMRIITRITTPAMGNWMVNNLLKQLHTKISVQQWLNPTRNLKKKLGNFLVNSKNEVKSFSTLSASSVWLVSAMNSRNMGTVQNSSSSWGITYSNSRTSPFAKVWLNCRISKVG